jgi:transcriptional regulator with XRE-family HTH domain
VGGGRVGGGRAGGGGRARRGGGGQPPPWDPRRVRRLREHLGESQTELARRLGARQQTVSEWETGTSRPRGMSRRLLHLVAEESGFYRVEGEPPEGDEAAEGRR